MDLPTICEFFYPILVTVLAKLSASDAASFLWATRLTFRISQVTKTKYLHILRDIPEHLPWIQDMLTTGHKVVLVGEDLRRLKRRIFCPNEYLRHLEQPIHVWLCVVPMDAVTRTMAHSDPDPDGYAQVMNWNGRLTSWLSFAVDDEATENSSPRHLTTMFVPGRGGMVPYPSRIGADDWYLSTLPNLNNLKVLIFVSTSAWCANLRAYATLCYGCLDNPIIGNASITLPYFDVNGDCERFALRRKGCTTHHYLEEGIIPITVTLASPFEYVYGHQSFVDFVIPAWQLSEMLPGNGDQVSGSQSRFSDRLLPPST